MVANPDLKESLSFLQPSLRVNIFVGDEVNVHGAFFVLSRPNGEQNCKLWENENPAVMRVPVDDPASLKNHEAKITMLLKQFQLPLEFNLEQARRSAKFLVEGVGSENNNLLLLGYIHNGKLINGEATLI